MAAGPIISLSKIKFLTVSLHQPFFNNYLHSFHDFNLLSNNYFIYKIFKIASIIIISENIHLFYCK